MLNLIFQRAFRGARRESGQVLVLGALSLTVVLGVVALATDVGMMLHEKRILQTAADSAAIAGAAQLGNAASNPGGGATHCITNNNNCWYNAAIADAVQNGVPSSAVAPHNGPTLGPHAGNASYVEVIITQPQPTVFMRLFGLTSMSAAARAVATNATASGCIYTLGSSGTGFSSTGSVNVSMPSCSLFDNSNFSMTGSGTVTAQAIDVVGTSTVTGSGRPTPGPTTGVAAAGDPLSSLSPPSFLASSCGAAISYTGSSSHTVTGPSTPGGIVCYNGFSNTGSGSVTFPAGTYVINGNFSTTGSGNISGSGVTIYLPSSGDSFSMTGSGNLNLSAPTSGPYSGILFYQNPSDTRSFSVTGSGSSVINGIFYAPSAAMTFTGSGSGSFNADIVVKSLRLTGSGSISEFVPPAGTTTALSSPRLVE